MIIPAKDKEIERDATPAQVLSNEEADGSGQKLKPDILRRIKGMSKKSVMIAGGSLAVLIAAVIIAVALAASSKSKGVETVLDEYYANDDLGISFSYPSGWNVEKEDGSLYITSRELLATIWIFDATEDIYDDMETYGLDIVSATESYLQTIASEFSDGGAMEDFTPMLSKSGDFVAGYVNSSYEMDDSIYDVYIEVETFGNRIIVWTEIHGSDTAEGAGLIYDEIRQTMDVSGSYVPAKQEDQDVYEDPNDYADPNVYEDNEYEDQADPGESAYAEILSFYDEDAGINFDYPSGWEVFVEENEDFFRSGVQIFTDSGTVVLVQNMSAECEAILPEGGDGNDLMRYFLYCASGEEPNYVSGPYREESISSQVRYGAVVVDEDGMQYLAAIHINPQNYLTLAMLLPVGAPDQDAIAELFDSAYIE
jgi:hypothetical protein